MKYEIESRKRLNKWFRRRGGRRGEGRGEKKGQYKNLFTILSQVTVIDGYNSERILKSGSF